MDKPPKNFNELIAEEYGLEQHPKKEKSIKEKKQLEKNVSYIEDNIYILEQVGNAEVADVAEGDPGRGNFFLRFNKKTESTDRVTEYEKDGVVYKPINDDTYSKGGISLPSGVKNYKNTKEITDQIHEFIKANCEVPPFYEKLFPNLVLFYWVYEKFPFIPYIHFVGSTSTGKTTAMEVLGSICYKSIDTTGSLTIASIFRLATSWRGTLLIDEFDSVGEGKGEIISFLKAGVSNRLVLRTEGDIKKEVKAYIVKAPKMFTSENPISDPALQSRTIVVRMQKNTRRLPLFKLPEYYEEAEEIKNKLLLWRLKNLNKIDLRQIKYGFPDLEAFDRRVQQIVTPVYYFSDDENKKALVQFAKEQEEETKRERREALDGIIFSHIADLWDAKDEAQIKAITTSINENNQGYKNQLTEKKVGNIIRKVLGFETEVRGHDKLAYVVQNSDMEKEKRAYYGIPYGSDLTSATSATPAENIVDEAERIFNE